MLALEKTHRRRSAGRLASPRLSLRQRGTAMVVTLIALTGLGTLGTITMLSVEGGLSTATADRSHAIAIYAAESGIMVGLKYVALPAYDFEPYPARGFSYLVLPGKNNEYDLPGLPGNRVMPGGSGNVFSASMKAWYNVRLKNNPSDPAIDDTSDFEDTDGRVIFVSTGFGPNRATATIEAEVSFDDASERYVVLSWREVE